MNKNTHLNIASLKERLHTSREVYEAYKKWIFQREELDQKIENLKREIDYLSYDLHQNAKLEREDPKAFTHRTHIFKQKKELLKQLKIQRGQLDHLIDESEELSETIIEQLRDSLILTILDTYPEQRLQQENRANLVSAYQQLEQELASLYLHLNDLKERLAAVLLTRHHIKGKGLLSYVIGTSPNSIIEMHFKEGDRLIQILLPLLQSYLHHTEEPSLKEFYHRLQDLLQRLHTQFHQPWGFRHIDTVFNDFYQQTMTQTKQIEEKLIIIRKKKDQLIKEIEDWIQQY